MTTDEIATIDVTARGVPGADVTGYALEKIRTLGRYACEPVLYGRVRVLHLADPAVRHRFVARGSLDVNGHPVHAEVAADSATAAIDVLHDVLRCRLERLARGWGDLRATRATQRPRAHAS